MIDHVEPPLARGPVNRRNIDDADEAATRIVAQKTRHRDDLCGNRGDRQFTISDGMAGRRAGQRRDDHLSELVERLVHRSPSRRSIHDKQPRARRRARAMRIGAIGDLIAHAGLEHERASVLELGRQFAVDAKQDVPLAAPVVGDIARRIVDHADTDLAELARAPGRFAGIARMPGRRDGRPVGRSERDIRHPHHTTARSCRSGESSSATAAHRTAAPPPSAGSPARRYRPARCGRSRAPPNRNSGSSHHHWRRSPWR